MALEKISVVTKAALQKYHTGIKNLFVAKEDGKGLSTNDYTTAEKEKLAAIEAEANKTIVEDVLTSTSSTNALSAAQGKALNDKIAAINTDMAELGAGDMLKSTYDIDNDGVVDNAAKLGGQLPSYYATAAEVAEAKGSADAAQDAADQAQEDVDTLETKFIALKSDVDAFFSDADFTESAKDTLKEIQEYIDSDATAAASMTASIKTNADAIAALQADHYNSTNLVEITDAEINAILAS